MKRATLLAGYLWIAIQAFAQNENSKNVPTEESQTPVVRTPTNRSLQPVEPERVVERPLLEPFNTLDSTAVRPTVVPQNDHATLLPLLPKLSLHLEGEQKQFLNLGGYNRAYIALAWQVNRTLNLTAGLLALKQYSLLDSRLSNRFGVRFSLNYDISDRLTLNVWGQHLSPNKINYPSGFLFPQTGAGGSILLNLGGGSQFGIGSEYLYDTMNERWNYQSGGKVKLNF